MKLAFVMLIAYSITRGDLKNPPLKVYYEQSELEPLYIQHRRRNLQ